MTFALFVVILLLSGALTLASYVERIYHEMGKFLSREFTDNIESFEQKIEPKLGDSNRIALSMAILAQMITATISIIVGHLVFASGNWTGLDVFQALLSITLIVVIFNRIVPFVFFTRTAGDWLVPFVPVLKLMMWAVLPVVLVVGFCQSVAALAEESEPQEQETTAEAVEALIEAGQEEGILEESDRQLIQSVVEFGDKTVREVMTPRPEIVAVPATMTIADFTELIRKKPYSRVPVYEADIDHVKGIVFAHDVLQVSDTEAQTRTVKELMRSVQFVPESKKVQQLLREMQRENQHMSIVVDEYGTTAGVVTIEDLVEEIVGEIRDEHEERGDVIRENDESYIVPGNMDVDRLAELFGKRPEGWEATTISGLVTEFAGHIPQAGEVIEQEGLRFEVLESTDRRVERLRVRSVTPDNREVEAN